MSIDHSAVPTPRLKWPVAMRRGHLWLGVMLAALVFVSVLTGAVLVFYIEIDNALMPELRAVPSDARPASWQAVYEAIQREHPERRRLYDIHKLTLIGSVLVLLPVVQTGVLCEFPQQTRPLLERASPSLPRPHAHRAGGARRLVAGRPGGACAGPFPGWKARVDRNDGRRGLARTHNACPARRAQPWLLANQCVARSVFGHHPRRPRRDEGSAWRHISKLAPPTPRWRCPRPVRSAAAVIFAGLQPRPWRSQACGVSFCETVEKLILACFSHRSGRIFGTRERTSASNYPSQKAASPLPAPKAASRLSA